MACAQTSLNYLGIYDVGCKLVTALCCQQFEQFVFFKVWAVLFVCCCFVVCSLRMNYWCQMRCCWTRTLVWECIYTVVDTCSWHLSIGGSYTRSVAQCCLTLVVLCSVQSPRSYCRGLTPCVRLSASLLAHFFSALLAAICSLLMIMLTPRQSRADLLPLWTLICSVIANVWLSLQSASNAILVL